MLRRLRKKRREAFVNSNRLPKAKMIEAILEDFLNQSVEDFKVLDIGCGNGDISEYFSQRNKQYAVDIIDKRKNQNDSFNFFVVISEKLPFTDCFFDIVISNHVIEHVVDQGLHLEEIKRVLKPGGVCYLGTPNKSSPIMKGHIGNDKLLRFREMVPFFEKVGFECHEYGVKVIKEPEKYLIEMHYGKFFPLFLTRMLRPLFPSHIFILKKNI